MKTLLMRPVVTAEGKTFFLSFSYGVLRKVAQFGFKTFKPLNPKWRSPHETDNMNLFTKIFILDVPIWSQNESRGDRLMSNMIHITNAPRQHPRRRYPSHLGVVVDDNHGRFTFMFERVCFHMAGGIPPSQRHSVALLSSLCLASSHYYWARIVTAGGKGGVLTGPLTSEAA
jgi:hypothetical protein